MRGPQMCQSYRLAQTIRCHLACLPRDVHLVRRGYEKRTIRLYLISLGVFRQGTRAVILGAVKTAMSVPP
jgi:hypothetical protein